jgi:hypothetical protein
MEDSFEEYSKLLDETQKHLSLQSLTAYINLPGHLGDKEKQFISNHLAECRQCSDAFNLIFDENLEIDEKKNEISLFRQLENTDNEPTLFRSDDRLVEIEITRLTQSDFNVRFLSLPSKMKNEKAALKINSEYVLRLLFIDVDTMYIIHSQNDIVNSDSVELVSLASPVVIPQFYKKPEPERTSKFYWYTGAAMVILASAVFIYIITRPDNKLPNQDEAPSLLTNLTPEQKSVNESDTVSGIAQLPDKNEADKLQNAEPGADHYAENSSLETLIGSKKEDSTVEIISPAIGASVQMPVRFAWMNTKKNVTLRFIILNNQNKPVYERLINGKELTLDTRLNAGLYYWKLEYSGSLVAMSKFITR